MMSGGAFLGALTAPIDTKSPLYVVFYSVLPAITLSSFIAFLFVRHRTMMDARKIARSVLDELPDPDQTG